MQYNTYSWERTYGNRSLKYNLAYNTKEESKLLVLINDSPDTLDLAKSALAQAFFERGFHILIPVKAGSDPLQKRSLDSKDERVQDLAGLIQRLDSLHSQFLVVFGMGEGAYTIPELSQKINASHLIMLNAGFHSPFYELQKIASLDSLAPRHQELLSYYGLSQQELMSKLQLIRQETYGIDQLATSSNQNWLSYYADPLINELFPTKTPLLWINFESYPLLTDETLNLVKTIYRQAPKAQYKLLKGEGNLNNQEEMNSLLEQIRKFFNWR